MSAYLTAASVAETLGVSTRTVLRWIDRGELEAVRLPGGRLRVAEATLAAYLAGWSTSSSPEAYAAAPTTQVGGHRANGPARGNGGTSSNA